MTRSLAELSPGPAVAALRELGVPPARAAVLAEAGAVYAAGDLVLVARFVRDILTGEPYLLVPLLAPAAPGSLEALRDALAQRWPVRRAVVRVPRGAGGGDEDVVRLVATLVEKAAAPGAGAPPIEVRSVDRATEPFVHRLLAEAIAAGARAAGDDPSPDAVAAHVRRTYRFDEADGVRAAVGFDGDEPVGHATWRPGATDLATGADHVELVDVSVIPTAAGHGIGAALTAHVEKAAGAGRLVRGHVTALPDGGQAAILSSLERQGWHATSDLVALPLH